MIESKEIKIKKQRKNDREQRNNDKETKKEW
jgi:hypothetical protein